MDHAALIREFYVRYVADPASGLAMLTEDVSWQAPDCLPYGGSYRGRDGVTEYATKAAAYYDFITVEVEHAVQAAPGLAIATGTFGGRAKQTQTDFAVPFCQTWEFRGDQGAALRYWNDSGAVLRALGLAPSPLPA